MERGLGLSPPPRGQLVLVRRAECGAERKKEGQGVEALCLPGAVFPTQYIVVRDSMFRGLTKSGGFGNSGRFVFRFRCQTPSRVQLHVGILSRDRTFQRPTRPGGGHSMGQVGVPEGMALRRWNEVAVVDSDRN
eukprot:364461-Chlamydomonas_euryale.AAC.5